MLTTKEISKILSVSEETVRRWIRTNDLKAIQEGKSYLVDSNDLTEFVQKKAKEGTTTIGKIASLLPIVGGDIAAPGGIIASGTAMVANASISKIIKMINSKGKATEKEILQNNMKKHSLEEIEDYLDALIHQRRKIDLEYQMNLLQIDTEISKYQKIKQKLDN